MRGEVVPRLNQFKAGRAGSRHAAHRGGRRKPRRRPGSGQPLLCVMEWPGGFDKTPGR
jgi:hypothetical protein